MCMIRAYISYRKPCIGIAEARCDSLYPSSTYPYHIVRAYDAYSIPGTYQTWYNGQTDVYHNIKLNTRYVLGATYISNNTLHIRLKCCCMMSYVYQMTLCYQVTAKKATDKYIANICGHTIQGAVFRNAGLNIRRVKVYNLKTYIQEKDSRRLSNLN